MKFQEGDLVFLIEPHVSADLGKVLEIFTDGRGDTGYIIEFWWQKKNTLASGDEYIPHFYDIDT